MRRALARSDVESFALGVQGDRPLPPGYLVLPAPGEEDVERYVLAHFLRVRENGFMVVLPNIPEARDYIEGLTGEDGEPVALVQREQIQAETVRGRHLGPAQVLLVDVPWSGLEYFVKQQAIKGLPDRASRVLTLAVGGTPGRPMAGDALDAANRWVDHLDMDTAQEYWASAQEMLDGEAVDEEEPTEFPRVAAPPPPTVRAKATPGPSRSTPQGVHHQGGLFGRGAGLTEAELSRLRTLAGGAPARTGRVEQQALLQAPLAESGLQLEAEFGAIPPPEVEDPLQETLEPGTSMQSLLLAQLRQNALLLEKLVSQRSGDGVQDALASGSANGSDGSSGIKGHLAREAFVKQVQDAKAVTAKVQANALAELGWSQPAPGLMREFLEKRVPLFEQKLLQHVGCIAAHGWEQGYRTNNEELQAFASRLLMFVEQCSLDAGKVQLAYLITGYPDPSPLGFSSRRAPGLKNFSRLTPAQWMAANLAYLKDLDYAETRIAQIANSRGTPQGPPRAPAPTDPNQETDDAGAGEKPPRRPRPRRPKNETAS